MHPVCSSALLVKCSCFISVFLQRRGIASICCVYFLLFLMLPLCEICRWWLHGWLQDWRPRCPVCGSTLSC